MSENVRSVCFDESIKRDPDSRGLMSGLTNLA